MTLNLVLASLYHLAMPGQDVHHRLRPLVETAILEGALQGLPMEFCATTVAKSALVLDSALAVR